MVQFPRTIRRSLLGVFAVTAAGGAAAVALAIPGGVGAPEATAATNPCAASSIAKTIGSVATSTGIYLDAHPKTDAALTTISQQQAGPQSLAALKAYFDANPDAAKDIGELQAPLVSLSNQCKLPVSLPQLLGLVQAVQGAGAAAQGGAPSSLPGTLGAAQTVGVPGGSAPTVTAPGAPARPGGAATPGAVSTTSG